MTKYEVRDTVFRKIGDERLLVPIKGKLADMQNVFTLNETSAFIWKKLEDGLEEQAIAHALRDQYGISAEQALNDCRAFVTTLLEEGLICKAEQE